MNSTANLCEPDRENKSQCTFLSKQWHLCAIPLFLIGGARPHWSTQGIPWKRKSGVCNARQHGLTAGSKHLMNVDLIWSWASAEGSVENERSLGPSWGGGGGVRLRVACQNWGVGWACAGLAEAGDFGGHSTTVWMRWALTPVYCDAGCSCAPHTHMASITASSSGKDEAYALSSEGVWVPAKQQPAPVSVCECARLCVWISVWLLNKLFLIVGEQYKAMHSLLFQQLPNFQPLTFTWTDHHHHHHHYSSSYSCFPIIHILNSLFPLTYDVCYLHNT